MTARRLTALGVAAFSGSPEQAARRMAIALERSGVDTSRVRVLGVGRKLTA